MTPVCDVMVRELAAWGLDECEYRSVTPGLESLRAKCARAEMQLATRGEFQATIALMLEMTKAISPILATYDRRRDLDLEMAGLDWMLGVVDLRRLLAFQRRLVLDPAVQAGVVPAQDDWVSLANVGLPPRRRVEYRVQAECDGYSLLSENPNLQWRLSPVAGDNASSPLQVHSGSPFFEVAEFRGRWFLRDGYHRAYGLLKANVRYAVAVVIRARSLEEVGATRGWFFDEEVLFCSRPPRVSDFLEDALTVQYDRPRLMKRLRVRVEETLRPAYELSRDDGR
jgi:hypothetical protein